MNKSNKSSDQPRTDATTAFLACRAATGEAVSILSKFEIVIFIPPFHPNEFDLSPPDEFRRTLCVESFNAFLEIFRLTQPAVAMAFEFDRDRKRRILGIVQELFRRSLRERGEGAELVDEPVGRPLEFAIAHAFGDDAPVERLLCGDPFRAHHDVLGT